ncbi:MAG: FAD-dependent oxidoreductase, partial [Microbacterium sp.]|nr:FAD-dependent oxidoreductase [Microbacterium sp.]
MTKTHTIPAAAVDPTVAAGSAQFLTPVALGLQALAVNGKQALYDFCAVHGVPHRRCGKLIVATSEQESGRLLEIKARAEANGVTDLELLTTGEAHAREPSLACVGALLSPST